MVRHPRRRLALRLPLAGRHDRADRQGRQDDEAATDPARDVQHDPRAAAGQRAGHRAHRAGLAVRPRPVGRGQPGLPLRVQLQRHPHGAVDRHPGADHRHRV